MKKFLLTGAALLCISYPAVGEEAEDATADEVTPTEKTRQSSWNGAKN